MKKLTELLSFVLIISMLLCIPVSASNINEFEPTGQLGDDVFYSYDKNTQVLRIYGSGATYDYDKDPPDSWNIPTGLEFSPLGCLGHLRTVVVEEGVTYLGSCLLRLEAVQLHIPASVNAVNEDFFYGCVIKSVYFYGNAPATVDESGEAEPIRLFDDVGCIYYLQETEGWDKFDVRVFDKSKHEYVRAENHLKTFCGAPYSDVAGDAWCAEAVLKMWEEGIMNGTELDYFSPDASLTRGMMATILYRMAGEPEYIGGAGSDRFADVGEGRFCDKAIGWAHANGIIEGYTDGSFKPDRALNRQELAALLYRYDTTLNPATTTDGDTVSSATDAAKAADWDTVSSFAKEAMLWAVKEGIINGTDSTKLVLSPFGTASRAQIAVMLCRYLA